MLVSLSSSLPSFCYSAKTGTNAGESQKRTCNGYLPYFFLFLLPWIFSSQVVQKWTGRYWSPGMEIQGFASLSPHPGTAVPLLPQFPPVVEKTGCWEMERYMWGQQGDDWLIWGTYNGVYSINGIGRKIGEKSLVIANSKKKYPGRPAEAPLSVQVVT